jgi:hypothetical protein
VNRRRVGHAHAFGQIGLRGQHQCLFAEGGIQRAIGQHAAERRHQRRVELQFAIGLDVGHQMQQRARGQALAGFPAVERVAVVRQQEGQFRIAVVVVDITGAEKLRSSEGNGALPPRGRLMKRKVCSACVKSSTRVVAPACFAFELQRQVVAFRVDQAERERDVERLLVRHAARVSMPTFGQRCDSVSVSVPGRRPMRS